MISFSQQTQVVTDITFKTSKGKPVLVEFEYLRVKSESTQTLIPLCIQFHYGTIRIRMHRDEGTPRLSSKMGLKDEDLKHFVCEEEDEMCDVRKKTI